MKITCDVIRDLLPLYAEDLASGDSRAVVEEHLNQCESCRRDMELLRSPPKVPAEEIGGISRVRREIVRRRWMAVLCAGLLLCGIFCYVMCWLTSPIYLPKSVVESAELVNQENRTVRIQLSAESAGVNTFQFDLESETESSEVLVVWTTRLMEMSYAEPEPRTQEITRSGRDIYYFTGQEGEENVLLWSHLKFPAGMMTLPRLVLWAYFMMALLLGAVLLAAAFLLRKRKTGKFLAGMGSFLWCYALCQGVICGFSFTSFHAHLEFFWALAVTVCLWSAGMLGWTMKKH